MTRWFFALWFFVILVSVHDAFLLIFFRSSVAYDELNPAGRWLLHLNGGEVWLMLAAKIVGTILAPALLLLLYWHRPRLGLLACSAVALFQLLLLLFLYFS